MKKRAAVARALALGPEILVLDEPSAGLDPIVAAELDELILLLKEALQMTVIVVTHELPSAFRIADRIAMLYQGSFSSVGTKDELKASQNPRVRQFLDRIPENVAQAPAVAAYLEKYRCAVQRTHGSIPHVSSLRRWAGARSVGTVWWHQRGKNKGGTACRVGPYKD
jgi:phospholipid/cholesterol/gamma-HCH transport system ATP-binding protein